MTDHRRPTSDGCEWACGSCPTKVDTIAAAAEHTRTHGGQFPAPGHFMAELPRGSDSRSRARRMLYLDEVDRVMVGPARSRREEVEVG